MLGVRTKAMGMDDGAVGSGRLEVIAHTRSPVLSCVVDLYGPGLATEWGAWGEDDKRMRMRMKMGRERKRKG